MLSLVPRSGNMGMLPRLFSEWENGLDDIFSLASEPRGLSISEDDQHVYVEAAVPGIDPEKIEVTFDKGMLWIRGQADDQAEDKSKRFYRRSSQAYSYRVAIPDNVREDAEPEATYKNGIMTVAFAKQPEVAPKKLKVKKA